MPAPRVREMTPADWPDVVRAYLDGIATGHATFATKAPEWSEWDAARHRHSRLVAVDVDPDAPDRAVGFAALSPTSRRKVYAGVAEVMIYVGAAWRGRGIGAALMAALITSSEAAGIWTLQAGVFPENTASIALHERFGFRVLGRQERVGCMDGWWRDVVLFERRSAVVGGDPF